MLKPVARAPLIRIRWRIFSLLFGFGFLAYLQQKSITVAAERMMPDLGLSQFQISLIEWAFVLGYGLFQVPGGIFGQRQGARRTFVIIGLAAFLATCRGCRPWDCRSARRSHRRSSRISCP